MIMIIHHMFNTFKFNIYKYNSLKINFYFVDLTFFFLAENYVFMGPKRNNEAVSMHNEVLKQGHTTIHHT